MSEEYQEGAYEYWFEECRDRSPVLSDLLEQILLVTEVIDRHRSEGSEGAILEQYLYLRERFRKEFNEQLQIKDMTLVEC